VTGTVKKALQERLERELDSLKVKIGLEVISAPGGSLKQDGEVKRGVIYVYDTDEEKAIDTLNHEFREFLIMQPAIRYKDLANMLILHMIKQGRHKELVNILIKFLNEEFYKEQERAVESLMKLGE